MTTKIDLTAGGRLQVHPLVNDRKVAFMSEAITAARGGGFDGQKARVNLAETLSTSDAPFSFAHLVNLRNLPEYDEAPRNWNLIASTEIVPDFEPATFYSLRNNFSALANGKDNDGEVVAPKVAELDTYQYAFGFAEEAVRIAVEKRGFKWGISLERAVKNIAGELQRIPRDMLEIGLDTDDFVVFRSLVDGVNATSQQTAGAAPISGAAVPINAPVSPDAIRLALSQIAQRTDAATGRRIPLARSYYVVVPMGMGESVEVALEIARNIISIDDGSIRYGGPTQGNLSRITGVIESEWIPDGYWFLVPAAGTSRQPSLVRVQLAGYTSPEVYVSNFNGIPVAGGASSNPFQAFSLDNDSIDLKFRHFTNAGLVTQSQIAWSNGTGVA